MKDEATPEMKMARRIAAHALCGPEKWKPGVKAGIYEEIMRGEADAEALVQGPLAAIIETTARAAELADDWLQSDYDESANCTAQQIRDELLSGVHLKGSPP